MAAGQAEVSAAPERWSEEPAYIKGCTETRRSGSLAAAPPEAAEWHFAVSKSESASKASLLHLRSDEL